jgi:selenocysteine-specific elongation factor
MRGCATCPAPHLPLEHDDPVKLFTGAAEVSGRARVLDHERVLPGQESWIQIRLESPLAAARGDRYIIRRASPPETIGGGVILDTAPGQRWKRFRPDVIARFETLRRGDPLEVALMELARQRGPLRRDALNLTADEIKRALDAGQLRAADGAGWVIHSQAWTRLADKTARILANFHAAEPLRLGMPRDALRSRCGSTEPFEWRWARWPGKESWVLSETGWCACPIIRRA